MHEQQIDIATAAGAMDSFIVCPDEGGPFPPVIFYMDAPGIREELRDMARRIATAGYLVVLPNLYYRVARDYAVDVFDADSRRQMWAWMNGLTNAEVREDTGTILRHLENEPHARPGPAGVVGYCMSGKFVLTAIGSYPERIGAMMSVYGVDMATDQPDSPHLLAPAIRGECYFAVAEIDQFAPQEMLDRTRAALDAAGVRNRFELFPGTHHGFAFPQRRQFYDKPAAETHWARMIALFRRTIG